MSAWHSGPPTPKEIATITAWHRANAFQGPHEPVHSAPRAEPCYGMTRFWGFASYPVPIRDPWEPSREETETLARFLDFPRAAARKQLKREKMEELARLAERALAVRPSMSLTTKAGLGHIVKIGRP